MASVLRIALANLRFPETPEQSVALANEAIEQASAAGAEIVCFPECFVPGYRCVSTSVSPPNAGFLEEAWSAVANAASQSRITVVLGTERVVGAEVVASAIVIYANGSVAGFQDKVQLDPSEDGTYTPGTERRVFRVGSAILGVVICHEGWRYPETVRWAAQHGAHIVFHLQFHEAEGDSYRPKIFCDPSNTFHEKALLCRAAENTCYFATANYASVGSPTTSAVINPDGTLLTYQPYGEVGLLMAEIDIAKATGELARRYKPMSDAGVQLPA